MHKEIVSTCSPNNIYALILYSVNRQEIPWRPFLLTEYVPMRVFDRMKMLSHFKTAPITSRDWNRRYPMYGLLATRPVSESCKSVF